MTPTDFQSALHRLGLSQADAARLLGVTPGAVTRWAQGARAVPGPVVRLLALCEVMPRVVAWLQKNCDLPENSL